MRKAFFEALFEKAKLDRRITLITADMGYGLFERWRDEIPKQFLNCGIAEQNAIMIAAGMASKGKKPYVYSISPFVTSRCHEQIRLDVCYNNTDIKIVGTGQGLDYGTSGTSHHATEDIAIMRALPNMDVICPADRIEAGILPNELAQFNTPAYIRLGRGNEPVVHKRRFKMRRGRVRRVIKSLNPKLVILSTGSITSNVAEACSSFRNVELYSVPWLKPIDDQIIRTASYISVPILTVEEHSRIGGLRSAVLESINDSELLNDVHSIALPDSFQNHTGDQKRLRAVNGLDVDSIRKKIKELMR